MNKSKKWEEHSFIILAYKESKYLEECILSLKNQSLPSNIIMTTSTPSGFLEQLSQKYNIPLLVNPEKKGIAGDWNFAYQAAKTPYVTLAHQDDIYEMNYLEEIHAYIKRNQKTLIAFSDYYELFNTEKRKRNRLLKIKKALLLPFLLKKSHSIIFFKKFILRFGNPISCPTVTYNKKLLPSNFKFDSNYRTNLDWDAWARIAVMNGKFVFINQKILGHRIHKEAETTLCIQDNKRREEDLALFKRFWPNRISKILLFFYQKSYNNIQS